MSRSAHIYPLERTPPEIIAERLVMGDVGVLDWGAPEYMVFVLVGRADIPPVTSRMNRIKGRPLEQPLAVAGSSQLAFSMTDLDRSPALKHAVRMRQVPLRQVLDDLFAYPVGVILPAGPRAPKAVTGTADAGAPTIMVVGQRWDADSAGTLDLFNDVVDIAATEFHVLLAGTSANRTGHGTFSVHQQDELIGELSDCVDFIVRRTSVPIIACGEVQSATVWDMTGECPRLVRHGSVDPAEFEPLLGLPRPVE